MPDYSTKRYLDTMHRIAKKTIANEEEFQSGRVCIQCKKNPKVSGIEEVFGFSADGFADYMDPDREHRERDRDVLNYCYDCIQEHYAERLGIDE